MSDAIFKYLQTALREFIAGEDKQIKSNRFLVKNTEACLLE